MSNDIKNELKDVLRFFEKGYIQRDVSRVDAFMDRLFDKEENIVIVGTSIGELCLGYDEARGIFSSDWKDWGDLRINVDEADVILQGDTALVYTTGSVKYSFSSNSDAYSGFMIYIKECFDQVSQDSKRPDMIKLTDINWGLCHILNQWEGEKREYLWDLRISFVLKRNVSGWKISQMQFSLPVVGHLPDVRLDDNGYDQKAFDHETSKMKQYAIKNTPIYEDEILPVLREFGKDYLNKEIDVSEMADTYFAEQDLLVINTDKSIHNDLQGVKKFIRSHRDNYEYLELDSENCLANSSGDIVWLATHGTFKKIIPEVKALENSVEIIKHIYESNSDDKDKLFKIRRNIAEMLKENARGEEYIWPLRLEAVLIKENDNWVFKYLQFSLPFNVILEGKTEAAIAL